MGKSVLLGINMEEDSLSNAANSTRCTVGSWPIKYLGLPLGGNPLKADFWEPVLIKVTKGWMGGRRHIFQRAES